MEARRHSDEPLLTANQLSPFQPPPVHPRPRSCLFAITTSNNFDPQQTAYVSSYHRPDDTSDITQALPPSAKPSRSPSRIKTKM